MAFNPITQFDFPNSSNYDSDLREILSLVKQLKCEYDNMYNGLLELDDRFKNYITPEFEKFKIRMDGLSAEIERTVNAAVDARMRIVDAEVAQEISEIKHVLELAQKDFERFNVELKRNFDTLESRQNIEFRQLSQKLTSDFEELSKSIESKFAWLEKRLDTKITLQGQIDRAYTRDEVNKLYRRIKDMFDAIPQGIAPIFNPTTGTVTDAQTAVFDVWDADRYGGATCWEMTVYAPTCEEWESNNLSCYELAQILRWILRHPLTCLNPLSGRRDKVCRIVADFSQEMTDDYLTVDQFEELVDQINLTVEQFDTWSNQQYYSGNGIPCKHLFLHSRGILMNEDNITTAYLRGMLAYLYQKINE